MNISTEKFNSIELAALRVNALLRMAEMNWGSPDEKGDWRRLTVEELQKNVDAICLWALGSQRSCDFCGKFVEKGKKAVSGPIALICEECLNLGKEALEEKTTP